MTDKLEITVEKTIEALARIERFVLKYSAVLTIDQKQRIAKKIKELEDNLENG